jgi:hypothetical protein
MGRLLDLGDGHEQLPCSLSPSSASVSRSTSRFDRREELSVKTALKGRALFFRVGTPSFARSAR